MRFHATSLFVKFSFVLVCRVSSCLTVTVMKFFMVLLDGLKYSFRMMCAYQLHHMTSSFIICVSTIVHERYSLANPCYEFYK